MTMLSNFITSGTFQELTGVSSTTGLFTVQNAGGNDFYLYVGTTPNEDDSLVVNTLLKNSNTANLTVDNTTTANQIWVKQAAGPTKIVINQG